MKNILKNKITLAIFCVFGLITMLIVPNLVFASEVENSAQDNIQPRWSYLWACDNGIDYSSNITRGICLTGSTRVYSGYAGVDIQLQKYVDSCECWINVPTYFWSAYEEDDYVDIFEDDISLSKGVYRCNLVHTAYDTDGLELESFIAYSDEITIR